jgi:hypothetical protein
MPRARILDGAVVVWVLLWLWAGLTVGHEVRKLAGLGDTAGQLGTAVTAVGRTISGIPVIGGQAGGAVENAGRAATASARQARDDTRRLGLLLGLAIGLVPTLPLLLAYVPGRVVVERERRVVVRALAGEEAGATEELLAMRAIAHLPLDELRRVSLDPAGDLRAGRVAALADAELARLELSRGRLPPPANVNGSQ